ncbi:transposase domain-containing protein [Billgrantia ethanolica]|uniref:DNA-binding protein n=1 Tax=Billgrantia ethanolica TaxID=2733486 RepID=A0ABS9A8A5_9GAMM|nr:transposase domain-containing protein [Halomonas ethanolica]MCE8004260.1 DNA-binding protein [Halomonas ethanolica]
MTAQDQQWFTAQELAGLPGMPTSERAILDRGKAGEIERRKKQKGKGWEYSFSSLPVETQAALLKQQKPAPAPIPRPRNNAGPIDRESLWDSYERKPQSIKDEAARRLQALQGVERLVTGGAKKTDAIVQTAKVYGESRATMYRWMKLIKGADRSDWLALLAPGYTGRTATADCTDEAWEYFKAQYLRPEAPAIATCYEFTRQAAEQHGWKLPSLRTINRWVQEIPTTTRVLRREGEEAMMRLYPSQRRTVRDLHALYWLNGDGYMHNVFVKFPDGTVTRPKTWFWQDVYSRRIVGFRTDRTEHTDMIRLSLGDVLERFGIPEHITIDNTRAAANKWMTGGVRTRYRFKVKEDDPMGLLPQLGIQIHWTTVFNGKGHGQAKPVERTFGVGGLGEYADKRIEFKGAYTGPNVTAKPENYGETAIDFDEFCKVLADAIRHWNAKAGRNTEICAGRLSFTEAFDASYQRNADKIRRPTAAQRRMWLLTAEAVTVHQDGAVALGIGKGASGRNRYSCDALIDYIGRKVVVRFDPDRLHETVHVYQIDGRYIGEAECIHAVGFGDSRAAREWARNRTQRSKAAKAQAEAEQRMTDLQVAEYLPEPTPEDTAPLQTDVVRGSFGERKRAVGSDLPPESGDDEERVAERYGFDAVIGTALEHWKKQGL